MVVNSVSQSQARSQFPALDSGFAYLENAGGSQVPHCVTDAMFQFMRESYVQTTAGYPASDRATEVGYRAHEFAETLVGAEDKGKVILGSSTSQLMAMIAASYADVLSPGDEVVISVANHEANVGCWARLARQGVVIKWWGVDPTSGAMSLDELDALLTTRTKIVAIPHTSNLLGNIVDVAQVADMAHAVGARLAVDGVAYAAHDLMEVAEWGVDYYGYSTYKVYGPHMGVMFARDDAIAEIEGPNHFFVDKEDVPRKFELGCLSFEGCAGLVALAEYLTFLASRPVFDRETVRLAMAQMRRWESPVTDKLLGYLARKDGVRVVGPLTGNRMPTVSFVSEKLSSPEVASFVNSHDIGIRYGHMYSHRLTEALGVDTETGFVRVSAVHYNTVEEIDRLCEALDKVL